MFTTIDFGSRAVLKEVFTELLYVFTFASQLARTDNVTAVDSV